MITANDIKVRGVKAIEEGLKKDDRLSITVRGEVRYIVLTAEDYDQLRLAELEIAYQTVMKDIENGDFVVETADEHINRFLKKPVKKAAKKTSKKR
ncbi:MAG TPA: hypothetical protein VFV79_07530 [Saprospiraceae bacterium]|nr:hypothetical protein [Saprospiraceae bacterium]